MAIPTIRSLEREIDKIKDALGIGSSSSVTVDTYEEAVPYFAGTKQRRVYVKSDEAYNDGDPSHYDYNPGVGTAFMGIDYNYKE